MWEIGSRWVEDGGLKGLALEEEEVSFGGRTRERRPSGAEEKGMERGDREVKFTEGV